MRRDEVNALAKEMIDHGARVLTVEETYSLCSRLLALDAALEKIAELGCESYTPPHSCLTAPVANWWNPSHACVYCIARRALAGEE
jgi:hypothetical protein